MPPLHTDKSGSGCMLYARRHPINRGLMMTAVKDVFYDKAAMPMAVKF